MPTFIHRLELINGQSYVLGDSWPIAKDELEKIPAEQRQQMLEGMKALKIGSIFYRPEMREDVSYQELNGASTEHGHYEVWCLHENFGEKIRQMDTLRQQGNTEQQTQVLQSIGGVRVRKFPLDKVLYVDEILTPEEALEQIIDRNDQVTEEVEQQAAEQQPQQQLQPTNGQPAQGA